MMLTPSLLKSNLVPTLETISKEIDRVGKKNLVSRKIIYSKNKRRVIFIPNDWYKQQLREVNKSLSKLPQIVDSSLKHSLKEEDFHQAHCLYLPPERQPKIGIVKFDLKDAFDSITPKHLAIIKPPLASLWTAFPDKLEHLLEKCLFYNGRLPIGFPTSPQIMKYISCFIGLKIKKETRKSLIRVYNHYDDFLVTFAEARVKARSSERAINYYLSKIRKVLTELEFRINRKKTKTWAKGRTENNANSIKFLGRTIIANKDLDKNLPTRKTKRRALSLYYKYITTRDSSLIPTLRGYLSFLEKQEREFIVCKVQENLSNQLMRK